MNIAENTLNNSILLLTNSIAPISERIEQVETQPQVDPLKNVDRFFNNLKLGAVHAEQEYWTNLIPQDDAEMFARWVFAIMSVHTTWESNVRGYEVAMSDETWQECRNRLIGTIYGLGNAKTTYALALSYPIEAQLCCLDVHLLRFMGHDTKKGHANTLKEYERMENEWLARCDKHGVAPNVAREMYWNKVQNRRNSRYWSYCLER
jgi:hypothetical protein